MITTTAGRSSGPAGPGSMSSAAAGALRPRTPPHAVVIATGSTAAVPPIDGLLEARPWTSRDVTNLKEVPRRVAVIGGGVVACESATWLHGLGAEAVTIIEIEPSLLANLEPFAGEIIAEQFRGRGVTVLLGTELSSVRRPTVEDTGVGR